MITKYGSFKKYINFYSTNNIIVCRKLYKSHVFNIMYNVYARVLHAFWLKVGGGGGGRFEVKQGHPDFLQITLFFLNAVLLLYLKLFTCLEIIA